MIAFIASKESDYLQDLTYAGLAEILGKDCVNDFPRHRSYHKKWPWLFGRKYEYPRNLGYVPGKPPAELKDVSLIILGSAKPDALYSFLKLSEKISAPWVFLDGGDWPEVGGDFKRTGGEQAYMDFQLLCKKNPPALIFKRELSLGQREPNLIPFPFSFKKNLVPEIFETGRKQYEVIFWAVESSETRKKAFQRLKGRYDCDANGSVAEQTFRKYSLKGQKYFEALATAKIVLSFRGEGFDTLRYWEIPACGSMMISEPSTIQIPDNFIDGKEAVFCRPDLSDLLEKIDYYLAHDNEREAIALAGRKKLLEKHTHLSRAQYFIERVRERLSFDPFL